MKIAMRFIGGLLLFFGLVWIVFVTGGVFSQTPGSADIAGLAPAFAFHAVCMAVGTLLMGKAAEAKKGAVLAPQIAK